MRCHVHVPRTLARSLCSFGVRPCTHLLALPVLADRARQQRRSCHVSLQRLDLVERRPRLAGYVAPWYRHAPRLNARNRKRTGLDPRFDAIQLVTRAGPTLVRSPLEPSLPSSSRLEPATLRGKLAELRSAATPYPPTISVGCSAPCVTVRFRRTFVRRNRT